MNPFDHIPDDLEIDILSRLPGTSLMNSQYLSKSWFSIIQNQRFSDSFNSRSLNRGSRLLIAFNNCEFTTKKADMRLFFFTASEEGENKSSSSLVANLAMTIPSTVDYYYTRSGSGTLAHGFLCCSYQGRFLICNPTTRQIVTLPESGNDVNKKLTFKLLGYDPIDDQYKAMFMMASRCGDGDVVHKVLTLGGGDNIKTLLWRKIKDNTGPYVPYTKGICINGIVYYGATRPNTDRVIVCFDVRFEKISLMNPPLYIKSWEVGTNLINYRGKLAIIHTILFWCFLWVYVMDTRECRET
ncbi:F-box protein At1g30790 [Eutrema salsugineum]|uniref:F-box protein At1g30790 n=1 Tax=Eutrema salsugineum TaxID=72664 RepID=UPI000CED7D2A|nr:F-box protein At1g30790 [Eutrema salsugineum]